MKSTKIKKIVGWIILSQVAPLIIWSIQFFIVKDDSFLDRLYNYNGNVYLSEFIYAMALDVAVFILYNIISFSVDLIYGDL